MSSRYRRMLAATTLSLFVAGGCGSTLSEREKAAYFGSGAGQAAVGTQGGTGNPADATLESSGGADASPAPGEGTPAVPAGEAGSTAPAATGAAPAGGAGGGAAPPAAPAGPGKPAGAAPARGAAPGPGPSGKASAPAPPPTPGNPSTPAPAAPAQKAPIVLGVIGQQSGLIGQIQIGTTQAAQAWGADVNARGGLNGHPVKLVFADDQADPARALAMTRRVVEQDGAVALFAHTFGVTLQAVTPYLEEKGVPIVAGCNCHQGSSSSSMVFEIGTQPAEGLAWALLLPLKAYSDKTKVSVLYCREAPVCQVIRDGIRKFGPQVGIEVVHEAQTSLTQPDFTAEVLAARNAGAEALLLGEDNNSSVRIARSAHRQGWSPLIGMNWSAQEDRFPALGGEDVEGFLIGGMMPHWDSPKLADFRAAMKRIPNAVLTGYGVGVWTGGKILENLAAGFPDKVTSADVVNGLHGLKGETMGGLIPPLTYRAGQGHGDSNLCVVPMQVTDGKLVPKDGDNFACKPGWQPVTK